MSRRRLTALLGLIVLLSACGAQRTATLPPLPTTVNIEIAQGELRQFPLPALSHGPRPEWLIPSATGYPDNSFYTIHSRATTPLEAAKQAYADAVEFLRPAPEAASIDALAEQIRVIGIWHDGTQSHALVTLPRRAVIDHLRQQVDQLDEATRATVLALQTSNDPLIQIGLLQTAIKRQQLRALYQKSFKRAEGEGRESPWDTRRWSLQLSALMKELLITPKTNSSDPALEERLKLGLLNAGMHAARHFEADYVLSADLDIHRQQLPDGYAQARGELTLKLRHIETGRDYGTQRQTLEVTAMSAEDARQRLLRKAERLLSEDKRNAIIDIAEQQAREAELNAAMMNTR